MITDIRYNYTGWKIPRSKHTTCPLLNINLLYGGRQLVYFLAFSFKTSQMAFAAFEWFPLQKISSRFLYVALRPFLSFQHWSTAFLRYEIIQFMCIPWIPLYGTDYLWREVQMEKLSPFTIVTYAKITTGIQRRFPKLSTKRVAGWFYQPWLNSHYHRNFKWKEKDSKVNLHKIILCIKQWDAVDYHQ